jgi:uncharacterized membrane protein
VTPGARAPLDLDAVPKGWRRNPSSWRDRVPIAVLALVATGIAGYMALYQWGVLGSAWDPFFGRQTEDVLASDVSRRMHGWFHVPDAALGAIAYLGDALFGLAGSTRRWQDRPWLVILFGIDVIPLGAVSAILVVLQGAVVGAWCTLCLVTAAISLALVALAWDEVWISLRYLAGVRRRSATWRPVWDAFWGRPTPEGWAAGLEITGGR